MLNPDSVGLTSDLDVLLFNFTRTTHTSDDVLALPSVGEYDAPEADDPELFSEWSDLYSLGCLIRDMTRGSRDASVRELLGGLLDEDYVERWVIEDVLACKFMNPGAKASKTSASRPAKKPKKASASKPTKKTVWTNEDEDEEDDEDDEEDEPKKVTKSKPVKKSKTVTKRKQANK